MAPFDPFRASSRPRRWCQSSAPKTPEPTSEEVAHQQSSSPPTRLRFRLRRRPTTQLRAPTTQFLASVAAADVPLPSIEEPQVYDDEDMLSIAYPAIPPLLDRFGHTVLEDQSGRGRTFSPPKTPGSSGLAPSLPLEQFPDWSFDDALSSLESSPEYESSRPSTARSTQTSSSLFSRYSFASEDLSQCASPESEHHGRFGHFLAPEDAGMTVKPTPHQARSAKSRRAPWTKPMSQHLWSTYMTYLQDPKVTPFRVGKSGIPPTGVCMRVAREAKRSWKGSRPQARPGNKSRSSTPVAESAGPYIEWPHTCAATRGRLRELCKAHSAATARHIQYLSNSPTPFGKGANRLCTRRSLPARSASVFSASDMAMSLTVCTAESMQIRGPLAQLTSSQPDSCARRPWQQPLPGEQPASSSFSSLGGDLQQSWPPRRLGSPFMARSYGPSSSSGLAGGLNESPDVQRQSHTVGTRRCLGSPVRMDQQGRSSMQKRRSRQSSALEPRRTKRPSLGSDFWTDPAVGEESECQAQQQKPLVEFSSTDSKQRDNLFVPRTNLQQLFEASNPTTPGAGLTASASFPISTALASQTVPARLGSPFSATRTTSHSFPNRHSRVASSSLDMGGTFRPLATVPCRSGEVPRQSADNAAASTPNSTKNPLINRLAYIDERLKDFRRRGRNQRRSEPPT